MNAQDLLSYDPTRARDGRDALHLQLTMERSLSALWHMGPDHRTLWFALKYTGCLYKNGMMNKPRTRKLTGLSAARLEECLVDLRRLITEHGGAK